MGLIMAKLSYKKVGIKPIEVVEEKPLKYWLYKIPNPYYLNPIPYQKTDLKMQIDKLIKFCKK